MQYRGKDNIEENFVAENLILLLQFIIFIKSLIHKINIRLKIKHSPYALLFTNKHFVEIIFREK